jgi:hypothetical protein
MEVNLLHINVKKCCYLYFSPSKRGHDDEDGQYLTINNRLIKRVKQTKFLGVIIDDKLSWKPHILSLNKKLSSICGRIYRIKKILPESLYKQIYHSLFESHLGYSISVWGGTPKEVVNNQLKPLFITQKKCIRILFGDCESYSDKFRTCARARPIESQLLGSEFYMKESTKPLFTEHELLTVENLYRYRSLMELFKIIKTRIPFSLYSSFSLSDRKDSYLITPPPTTQFFYKSAWMWNEFRKVGTINFTSPCSLVKRLLKKSLSTVQSNFGSDWCEKNFTEFSTS